MRAVDTHTEGLSISGCAGSTFRIRGIHPLQLQLRLAPAAALPAYSGRSLVDRSFVAASSWKRGSLSGRAPSNLQSDLRTRINYSIMNNNEEFSQNLISEFSTIF